MIRRIVIPEGVMTLLAQGRVRGNSALVLVTVDWPELQLTPSQREVNAARVSAGMPPLFEDRSLFEIELPVVG